MARLVVVSNRVAVPTHGRDSRAGGLEVAIRPVLRRHPGIWFGWSGQIAARPSLQRIERGHQAYVLTDLVEDDYQEYYNGYANNVLWPILHYRLDLAEFCHRDLSGYIPATCHGARRPQYRRGRRVRPCGARSHV